MPTTIQNVVRRTWRPPEGATILATDVDKHYKPWGFTIYRTCYSPGSHQQWSSLLNGISTAVSASLSNHEIHEEDPNSISIISKTFKLDARSDSKALDSLTMDQVSKLYREESGRSPMKMLTSLNPDHKIFLLADEEVLRGLDSGVIKVVQASPNKNVDPECFFQWMRIRVRLLVDFWINLENSDSGLWDFIYEEQPGAFYSG